MPCEPIDPRAGRHLAVHHQALLVEFVEVFPGRPLRHQVGVREQHARRIRMGAEHAHGFAGLDQQRFVGLQFFQRFQDPVVRVPVARRAPDAAVDHQRFRPLGDFGSRLFWIIRYAASISQFLQVSLLPRGARMWRVVSRRGSPGAVSVKCSTGWFMGVLCPAWKFSALWHHRAARSYAVSDRCQQATRLPPARVRTNRARGSAGHPAPLVTSSVFASWTTRAHLRACAFQAAPVLGRQSGQIRPLRGRRRLHVGQRDDGAGIQVLSSPRCPGAFLRRRS